MPGITMFISTCNYLYLQKNDSSEPGITMFISTCNYLYLQKNDSSEPQHQPGATS